MVQFFALQLVAQARKRPHLALRCSSFAPFFGVISLGVPYSLSNIGKLMYFLCLHIFVLVDKVYKNAERTLTIICF
jgi:hypothetical protein